MQIFAIDENLKTLETFQAEEEAHDWALENHFFQVLYRKEEDGPVWVLLTPKELMENPDVNMHMLANYLHREMCRLNHADGCSWGYELGHKNPWNAYTHAQYLKKAQQLVSVMGSIEQAFKWLEACKAIK